MRSNILSWIVCLLMVVAMPLAAARAETIYATLAGNLDASSQTSGSVVFQPLAGTTFAQRFITGTLPAIGDGDSSGQILYRFSWNLLPAQVFDPIEEVFSDLNTTYAVNLRTDAAGTPGTSLLLLMPATASLSAPGVVAFSYADLVADPRIALQSNTSYWLTVAYQSASETPGVQLRLPFTTGSNQTGPGTVDNLMVNTGNGWGGISERAIVQVQVEVVPEPSAIALAAAGIAILAWRGMRGVGRQRGLLAGGASFHQ
jgi:hypothetical protein